MKRLALACSLTLAATAAATPSGHKWFFSTVGPQYKVYAHTSINGVSNFSTTILPAVQNAFANWTKAKVSCTKWDVGYAGQFSSPSGVSALNGNDGQNLVLWIGQGWTQGNSTLGVTWTRYFSGTGEITDADMELNNNIVWSNNGTPGTYDYESVVLHESGHFLGLDHTTNQSVAVMYPSIAPGDRKRVLQPPDVQDVCAVYPGQGVQGSQGSYCNYDSNCSTNPKLYCRGSWSVDAGASPSKFCTVDCTTNPTCPSGYTCQESGPSQKSCLIPVGSPDLCKFCTSGNDCLSGVCLTDGQGHNWCTTSCSSSAGCGPNYQCVQGSGGQVCVPNSACSNQCTDPAQCAPGYACTSGRCEPSGNVGDRCEISGFCKSCGVCIGTSSEAYCRSCCGGQDGGSRCTSCSNTTCPAQNACAQVTGLPDKVCIPSAGGGTCAACNDQTPCQNGLTCAFGRCHAPCNPTNPGGCSACYAYGTSGICACNDEISFSGQNCGPQAGGTLAACVNGLACTGTPSRCYRTCVPGTTSCDANEQCQALDGKNVCVPSNQPGAKCGACISGSCGAGLTCLEGRCYPPCSVASPTCNSCVEVSAGAGVCACDDQRAGANQGCGYYPPDVYTCQPGLYCVGGKCRVECNLDNPTACAAGTTCRVHDGVPMCLPWEADGGGPAGDAGVWVDAGSSASPDAGLTPQIDNQGCGCIVGSANATLWPLAAMLGLALIRRVHGPRKPK